MQYLSLLLCLFLSTVLSGQATIDLTILNDTTGQKIAFYNPVSGSYFQHDPQFAPQDESGTTRIELETVAPAYHYLFGNFGRNGSGNWIQLFLKPGEHYEVTVDAQSANRSVSITGPAATYNQYLNSRVRADVRFPWERPVLDVYLKDSIPKNIKARMDLAKQADLEDLGTVAGLTSEQRAYAIADINLYYKSLFRYAFVLQGLKSEKGDRVLKDDWKHLITDLLAEKSGSKYDLASRWYQRLLDLRLTVARTEKSAELAEKFGTEESTTYFWAEQRYLLPGKEREPNLASFLADLIRRYPYDAATLAAYEDFKSLFPDSRYLPVLTAKLDKAVAKGGGKDKSKQENKRLDKTPYASLEEVLRASTKPLIYVDLWATWCSPCKRQFTKKIKLDAFLTAYEDRVEALYISIDDKPEDDEAIEKIITFYGLKGWHIRSSDALRSELFKLFGKGKSETLSIPRYLIATREGRILNPDANQPEDWEALRSDLEAALRESR